MTRTILSGLLAVILSTSALAQTTMSNASHRNRSPARMTPGAKKAGAQPTVAEAEKFIAGAEQKLLALTLKSSRASWVQSNFITDDTEAMAAAAQDDLTAATTELAMSARRFAGLPLPPDTTRKFNLLKLALVLPAPSNAAEREELTKLAVSLESDYGKGKYCPTGDKSKCLSLGDMERIMASSRDPAELQRIWLGWHAIAPPYRQNYKRFVELANKGARESNFTDVGAMWRAKYDMPPDAFAAEM